MILDKDIPTADPGELVILLTPLIYKIARHYQNVLDKQPAVDLDDLLQSGRLLVFNAQKKYDPSGGASFTTYIFKGIHHAMQRTLGFNSQTGAPPEILESLDEPLNEESEDTRKDFIPDEALTAEERIVEQDGHQETADAVREAVDRLKNDKQREIIKRAWFDGESKESIAADLGMSTAVCRNIDLTARHQLKRDKQLRQYAALQYPMMRVGAGRFRSTWTSATEASVLWRERKYDYQFGDGAFLAAGRRDPENVWTSIWMEANT